MDLRARERCKRILRASVALSPASHDSMEDRREPHAFAFGSPTLGSLFVQFGLRAGARRATNIGAGSDRSGSAACPGKARWRERQAYGSRRFLSSRRVARIQAPGAD